MIHDVIHISQEEAEKFPLDSSWVVISITNAEEPPAKIPDGHSGLLRLGFVDDHTFKWDPELKRFDEGMANAVIDFTENLSPEVKHILVHCAAGVCRSAAVARYIAQRFFIPYDWTYDLYHKKVFTMLVDAKHRRQ